MTSIRTELIRMWMKLAHFLGRMNSAILLSLIYWLLIVPFALILKLFTAKFRFMRLDAKKDSYLEPVEKRPTADMEKPY